MLGAAAFFVDATNAPFAAEHAVVHVVFVKTGAEPGGAHLESHSGVLFASFERDDGLHAGLQVFELDDAGRVSGLQKFRRRQRDILLVAISTRNAVDGYLVLHSAYLSRPE